MGINSALHIIIFDEIDAICRTRGSLSGSSGVHDTVVNQLLAKVMGKQQCLHTNTHTCDMPTLTHTHVLVCAHNCMYTLTDRWCGAIEQHLGNWNDQQERHD